MIRLLIGIVLGMVVIVFAVQNTETVTYNFLAWSITAPRAVLVVAVFIFGLLSSWLITGLGRLGRLGRRRR
jgi:uncharacterized integral membrane protein